MDFHRRLAFSGMMVYRLGMKLLGGLLVLACIAGCPDQAKNDSKKFLNNGNKAIGAKQFDTAITEYQHAIEKWSENHLAHYGMGAAQMQRGEWEKAVDSFGNAVRF